MNKHFRIETVPDERPFLYYPKKLDFDETFDYVGFGSLVSAAEVRPHNRERKTITISSALQHLLHIPNIPLKLHLFPTNQTLFLGPIVGIFTAGFTNFSQLPLGNRSYQFAKFFPVGSEIGVFPILFGVQHINWEKGIVNGYVFHENQWKEIDVPLPNVIYDRLPNRKVEQLRKIREAKIKLSEEYVIPFYNPGFFSKMDVYQKLLQYPKTEQYLPKTVLFQTESDLKKMLEEFEFVYVKPNEGSLGNGVYQIKRIGKDLFCRFRDERNENRLVKLSSVKGVIRHLFEEKTDGTYVIQQGVFLVKRNECPLDFRVHTNKGKSGKWYVTAIAAKIASRSGATTHLLSGGSVQTVKDLFPDKKEQDRNIYPLIESALILSKQLDKQYNGQLAEIGFDLGIDEHGKVWMFEANSKPGRSIFNHPQLQKYERIIQKCLLSYGVTLTENVLLQPEKFFEEDIPADRLKKSSLF
ncbi:YheC/YheD family protein [Fervidibacillus albus]|uniref:YheC/YheD family protein n=1 Tax=Fervidibacillus albus TaxID=2980026 RepID=A0A9E8RWS5_9BACI|nr:YheC/YheD family protein [Fervidibacillus albus]WAA08732.1 YheC/YheD family protein [Fervidibacillus albus]